ncbi:MAG: hypothetical protein ABIP94_14595 [Planctomycetota bacterium]
MRRSTLLTVGFLLSTAACTSTAGSTIEMAPMPIGETAPTVTGEPLPIVGDRAYGRSDPMHHDWTDGRGRRMHVVFVMAFSAPAELLGDATLRMRNAWNEALPAARSTIEAFDLATEQGAIRCELQLRDRLTAAWFAGEANGGGAVAGGAVVERVIWQRVTWD